MPFRKPSIPDEIIPRGHKHIINVLTGASRQGDFVLVRKSPPISTGSWKFHGKKVVDPDGNQFSFSKRIDADRLLIKDVLFKLLDSQEKE